MVKEISYKGRIAYECHECGLAYLKKEIARECEKFCKKNKSCNTELIKHAVKQ